MCEIHHQNVHIYFLLHTPTQEKALSAKMQSGLQREIILQKCNFHLCFSLASQNFMAYFWPPAFLLLLLPYIGMHLQKPLMKAICIYTALDQVLTPSQSFSLHANAWVGLWDLLQAQTVFHLLSSHGHMWTCISLHLFLKSRLFLSKVGSGTHSDSQIETGVFWLVVLLTTNNNSEDDRLKPKLKF